MLLRIAVSLTFCWLLVKLQNRARTRKLPVNWRGYKHLKEGMTAAQVEWRLGCPGDHCEPSSQTIGAVKYWIDDDLVLQVHFRADGTLSAKKVFLNSRR